MLKNPYIEVPYQPADGDPIPGSPHSGVREAASESRRTASGAQRVAFPDLESLPLSRDMPDTAVNEASTSQHETTTVSKETVAAEAALKHAGHSVPTWYKGGQMVRRIVMIVIVIAVAYLGYLAYSKWKTNRDYASGDIYSDDLVPGSRTRSGEVSTAVSGSSTAAARSGSQRPNNLAVPAGDSLPSLAPDGQAFTGSGHFQVYRQGNLTWRVNTDTGESCVLFATEEEWRKPLVYSHGCSAS